MEAQNDPKKMLVRENTIQEDRVFTVDIIWQNYKGNMSQVMNTNKTVNAVTFLQKNLDEE